MLPGGEAGTAWRAGARGGHLRSERCPGRPWPLPLPIAGAGPGPSLARRPSRSRNPATPSPGGGPGTGPAPSAAGDPAAPTCWWTDLRERGGAGPFAGRGGGYRCVFRVSRWTEKVRGAEWVRGRRGTPCRKAPGTWERRDRAHCMCVPAEAQLVHFPGVGRSEHRIVLYTAGEADVNANLVRKNCGFGARRQRRDETLTPRKQRAPSMLTCPLPLLSLLRSWRKLWGAPLVRSAFSGPNPPGGGRKVATASLAPTPSTLRPGETPPCDAVEHVVSLWRSPVSGDPRPPGRDPTSRAQAPRISGPKALGPFARCAPPDVTNPSPASLTGRSRSPCAGSCATRGPRPCSRTC